MGLSVGSGVISKAAVFIGPVPVWCTTCLRQTKIHYHSNNGGDDFYNYVELFIRLEVT